MLKQLSGKRLVLACLCGLVLLAVTAAPVRAQTPSQAAVDRGTRLIQKHQALIGRYMYPASTLKQVQWDGVSSRSDGGFEVKTTFHFTYFGKAFYGRMKFHFHADGVLRAIEVADHNTTHAPGFYASLFVNIIRDLLRTLPALRDSDTARFLLDRADARGLLEFYVRVSE